MVRRDFLWLAATFGAGVCLVALPHQSAPYSPVTLIEPSLATALAGLAGLAMMAVIGQVATPGRTWAVMALCLPAATLIRVLTDASAPWFAALAVSVAAGAVVVLPGVLAGALVRRMQMRTRS